MPNTGAIDRQNVLIVDGDRDLSYALAETISAAGDYEVDHAPGGKEAIAMLRSKSYKALFLDVAIPGVDGIGVLNVLMTDATIERPRRVIVVTAMRRGTVMNRAAHTLGADGIIYKPFGLNEIEAALSGGEPASDPEGFLAQPVRK